MAIRIFIMKQTQEEILGCLDWVQTGSYDYGVAYLEALSPALKMEESLDYIDYQRWTVLAQ